MRKLLMIAIWLALPSLGWAQGCYPGNTPTVAVSTVQVLEPSQVPFAVTLSLTDANGNQASHAFTVGNGTSYRLFWNLYGTSSVSLYSSWDNSTTRTLWGTLPNSNGSMAVIASSDEVGHVLNWILVGTGSSGATTQDIVKLTVTSQSSGIYASDLIGSNAIYQITTTYSGTPNILFSDCPHMQYAHHTPQATLQLQSTSGEVHRTVSATGTTVPANTNVYAVVSDYISANVGDTVTASYGGSMWCDLVQAWVWQSLVSFRIEYAKVVAKDLGHAPRPGLDGSSIYDVAVICNNDSDPPDWQPTVVHSFSGRHPYWWGFTSLFRAPDLQGVQWLSIAAFMTEIPPDPAGGPLTLARLVVEGGAVPYPANIGPDFPVPGVCTQYPKNVILTLSSSQIPWWPFSN